MKLSYNWLREYVKTKFSAEEVADKLTMAGLEVEEVIDSQIFSGVVIGEVVSKEKHPDADKLNVAIVNVGKEKLQIVCGAANLATGQRVPVALVGAKLGDFEIGKAKLRGIESHGMICSERELGISEEHQGIMVLEQDAPIGNDFGEYLGSDKVIDVKVLANRPDCMSVIGLAREVSAITKEKLTVKNPKIVESKSSSPVMVTVQDSDLCPRYLSLVVKNVVRNETPGWMKERLLSSGVRSIDLFVDISNYVMLEYGQPLHFFDLDKLTDKTIIVRNAKTGENIKTLDGVTRKLTPDNLVIANSKSPIALAGVMGGETTEIGESTKNIFIEAAVFDKASIRKTSRALGLRSEAVARYEKGISLSTPELAIRRAAELLTELADGEVASKITDSLNKKIEQKVLSLNPTKLNAFLGTNYSDSQIKKTLEGLGFGVTTRTKYLLEVAVPHWRIDIAEPVDLYEEVARIIGFESIPSTLPYAVKTLSQTNPHYEMNKHIRHELAAIGLTEIMTYSFASEAEILVTETTTNNAFELANPMVKEQKYMRVSLLPKMLESLAANQFLRESVKFFELGKTFYKKGKGLPHEKSLLSVGILGGDTWPIQYKDGLEYYGAKGAIDHLLATLRVDNIRYEPKDDSVYTTGRAATIYSGKEVIGEIGEVDQRIASKAGLKKTVAAAVIDIEKVMELANCSVTARDISRYQQSVRDISAIFGTAVTTAEIMDAISGLNPLIERVEIVDIYTGKNLEPGKKSITIRLTVVSNDHTLTEAEVEKIVNVCQNKLVKLGGLVRGSKA